MDARQLSKKKLIKQIATEVEDPELKEQLIDALLEQQEPSHHSWDSRPHMAVHPDAVPSNIRLKKIVVLIGGVIFFLWVNAWANGTPKTDTGYPFLRLMTILGPVIFWLEYKRLNNVSKWQRPGRKPPRKFWGAMIEPSLDKK